MESNEDISESEVEILLSMTPHERQLFKIEQSGKHYKGEMEKAMRTYRWFTNTIDRLKREVKLLAIDYNETKDEETLVALEEKTDWLQTFSGYKPTIRQEIKEARGKVQWLRKKYRQTQNQQLKKN